MTQQEATQLALDVCSMTDRQQRLLKVLYRKSGVKSRGTVLPHRIALEWLDGEPEECMGPTTRERMQFYEDHSAPLAERAVESAIEESGYKSCEITHLITVSCTGFAAPGVDIDLIQRLSLPPTTSRVQVGFMGCHGAINGLRVAQALVESDASARVLLCAVELCSLHYRFQWDPDRFIGNALFADGSAALICTADHGQSPLSLTATGSCLIPDSTDAMTWDIGDHGYEMFLSARVPDLIEQNLKPWLSEWLATHGLSIGSINGWAVHPGGPRILQAVEDSLELDPNDLSISRDVLAKHGNMSSPTVLFILDKMRKSEVPGPYLALGFGPGLYAEAALFS